MDDKFNTAAGWVLFAGIIALGSAIVSGIFFQADKPVSPEQPGYFIDAPEGGGEVDAGPSMEEVLNKMSVSEGEKVFAKCTACHTVDQGGANGIGPNLYGIMGKGLAQGAPGFAYSSALADKGGNWDWDNMSAWLKSPRAFANGTKMSFAGLSKIEDRAAVMLYMNANGSNLPVPEFVAAAADAEVVAEETEAEGDVAAEAEAEQDAAAELNEGGA
ncbi:c-type cytochrome [Qipengyuania sp. DGS5-3]|uniref:c-type cytochrome n=1 Tax=Qipengyuania sp. DGS5-3 TaxID=3349632 RepID=UPI0036D39C88